MRASIALLAALILGLVATPAAGQRAKPPNCRVDTSPPDFGGYSPLSPAPLTTIGTIVVICDPPVIGEVVFVSLSAGRSGRFLDRTMTHGYRELHYNLYADPNHLHVAGDGSSGTVRLTTTRGHGSGVIRVYGMIPPHQSVPAGNYSDNVHIDVEF